MLKNIIVIDEIEYRKIKKIKSKNKIYVEYRNDELKKIKFFEVKDNEISEVTNEEDLKVAIVNNYIVDNVS